MRGSSRAITGWIERIALAAGDVPEGKAIRIRVTGAKVLTFGKGSSVDICFEIAPHDKWPDAAAFDAHRGDDAPTNGASTSFGDMKDSPLDGPAEAAADAWA